MRSEAAPIWLLSMILVLRPPMSPTMFLSCGKKVSHAVLSTSQVISLTVFMKGRTASKSWWNMLKNQSPISKIQPADPKRLNENPYDLHFGSRTRRGDLVLEQSYSVKETYHYRR